MLDRRAYFHNFDFEAIYNRGYALPIVYKERKIDDK